MRDLMDIAYIGIYQLIVVQVIFYFFFLFLVCIIIGTTIRFFQTFIESMETNPVFKICRMLIFFLL